VRDIYKRIGDWLVAQTYFDPKKQNFKLMFRNQVIKEDLKLLEAGITGDATIYVLTFDDEKKFNNLGE